VHLQCNHVTDLFVRAGGSGGGDDAGLLVQHGGACPVRQDDGLRVHDRFRLLVDDGVRSGAVNTPERLLFDVDLETRAARVRSGAAVLAHQYMSSS
jgi:hypothetical protein